MKTQIQRDAAVFATRVIVSRANRARDILGVLCRAHGAAYRKAKNLYDAGEFARGDRFWLCAERANARQVALFHAIMRRIDRENKRRGNR